MSLTSYVQASTLILIFAGLLVPLIYVASPLAKSGESPSKHITTAIVITFFISLVPLLTFYLNGSQPVITTWKWMEIQGFSINISFLFDMYSLIFIPIALYITWSILQFATWYMAADAKIIHFFKYLLAFLIAMIILITANNLFQLFVGWEGVGIMSFLLIGWWYSRPDANTAALQAILYNRVGDVGLVFAMAWFGYNLNTWDLDQILANAHQANTTLPVTGLIVAATGKSAQFGLHPWLPSAMEGPTPVSALLHSSTMVVAGIFLLIRIAPLMENDPTATTVCLCLGALTTAFGATCALAQTDIKKIIAFSTSSQLGLMMVTIGLGHPQLAFLHICTHAFFKAMLFLAAGSIIHSLNGQQDIRKMGGLFKFLPVSCSCLTIGSLALIGTPFLTGFFSKDAIIEALSTSFINSSALALTLLATSFTAFYSCRLVTWVTMRTPRFFIHAPINEDVPAVISSLKRLAWGSIVAGLVVAASITFPKTPVMTMPFTVKIVAVLITLLGLYLALVISTEAFVQHKWYPAPTHHFGISLGYTTAVLHRRPLGVAMEMAQAAAQKTDQTWLEKFLAKLIRRSNIPAVVTATNARPGQTKKFLALYFITLALLIVPAIIFTL